jgi:hypothetical protein
LLAKLSSSYIFKFASVLVGWLDRKVDDGLVLVSLAGWLVGWLISW